MQNKLYRPEIDGLRAVAVVAVVLYHCNFWFIPGGFVGVDVFFVISGYLITSILVREASEGTFSYWSFYERRIRRLVPPLIAVLLVTSVASFAILPQTQFTEYVGSLLATNAFSANWYFLGTVGYFDGPADLKPLLHMWSLGVEEQYYLFFPIIVLALRRRPALMLPVFAGVMVGSLLLSSYLVQTGSRDQAFYSSLARCWELLAGSILAISSFGKRRTARLANVREAIGLALILAPMAVYTADMAFPGVSAVPPVVGTALLISTSGTGLIGRFLSLRPVVAIGLISYALYLWHWPVLVFVRYLNPEPHWAVLAGAAILSTALAGASYFLIERPIRNKSALPSRRSIYGLMAGTTALFVGFCILTNLPSVAPIRETVVSRTTAAFFDGRQALALSAIADAEVFYQSTLNKNYMGGKRAPFDPIVYKGWTCSFDALNSADEVIDCIVKQSGDSKNVLVAGDSIGRDTTHALRQAFPDYNFTMIHHSGCPPTERPLKDGTSCFPNFDGVLNELAEKVHFDAIILSYRFRPKEWKIVEKSMPAYHRVANKVIWLGASPMYNKPVSEFIRSLPSLPYAIAKSDTEMMSWNPEDLASEAALVAAQHDSTFVDVSPFYCDQTECPLWIGGDISKPIYWDRQHLTSMGIEALANYLRASAPFQ